MALGNLKVRLLTAAVVSPVLLLVLFAGPAWAFYLIVLLAIFLASLEVLRMTHPGDAISQTLISLASVGVSLSLYYSQRHPALLPTAMLVTPLGGMLLPLVRLGVIETAGLRMMSNVATPFYIGGLLTPLAMIRREADDQGAAYVLMTLMFAWMADTGGYFAGRYWGKTKLYEAVSPKKTREGFVGSLAGAAFGALLAHFWYLPDIALPHALTLALVAGSLGQMGDLAESLLKRSTGIKDSGAIIPGHGGILDRIDALLMVSPIVYLYLLWR